MADPNRQHQPCTHFVLMEQEGNDISRQFGWKSRQVLVFLEFFLWGIPMMANPMRQEHRKCHQSGTSFPAESAAGLIASRRD
jgi:hypothetical protein